MTTATDLQVGRRYDFHTTDDASYLNHELIVRYDDGAVLILGPVAHVHIARHELERIEEALVRLAPHADMPGCCPECGWHHTRGGICTACGFSVDEVPS